MTKAKGPTYKIAFRRRREGKTDYKKRLALVKSSLPRMVVRKSNRYVGVQFVVFKPKGDVTLCTVTGKTLIKEFGWPSKRNVWSAYLAGLYAGKKALKHKVSDFVLDCGMHTPSKGSVIYAALKGAIDAGLKTNYSERKIPSEKISAPSEEFKELFEKTKKMIMEM